MFHGSAVSHDLEVDFRLKQPGQTLAKERVIVDDKDANGFVHGSASRKLYMSHHEPGSERDGVDKPKDSLHWPKEMAALG
jgi:hypothetical protein